METAQEKVCSLCGKRKSVLEFHINKTKSDGYDGRCKVCVGQHKAKAYKQRKKAKSATEQRRKKTSVANVASFEINEIYVESANETIEQVLADFVEMVLWQKKLD